MPDPSITPTPQEPVQGDRWASLRPLAAQDGYLVTPGVSPVALRSLLVERDQLLVARDELAAVLREMVDHLSTPDPGLPEDIILPFILARARRLLDEEAARG